MRRGSTAAMTANMGFSFDEKGERPTLAGTGVPVRVCLARARRLGTGLERPAWDEGPTPCGVGLRSTGGSREATIYVQASARRPTGSQGCGGSHPGRGRGTRGQVSTATPAKLDFRAAGAADEGLVNAMSTGSRSSMRVLCLSAWPASICHPKSPGTARDVQFSLSALKSRRMTGPKELALHRSGWRVRTATSHAIHLVRPESPQTIAVRARNLLLTSIALRPSA